MAILYKQSDGFETNLAKPVRLYKRVVVGNDSVSALNLEQMYFSEQGVKRNFLKESQLPKNSSDFGNAKAMYKYSMILTKEVVQPRDISERLKYLRSEAYNHLQDNIQYLKVHFLNNHIYR
jgi:TPR repeat protein